MEDIVLRLKDATISFNSEIIQEILIAAKRNGNTEEENGDSYKDIINVLWTNLSTGLEKLDDQLLCATCFYTVLSLVDELDYLEEIEEVIRNETKLRDMGIKESPKTLKAVALMYGMFQSSFLLQQRENPCQKLTNVLEHIFKLLNFMAFEYSKYTFIIFKTINSFKKICGSSLEECLFSNENKVKILNLVNHNWENPITGVRDLNKSIFRTLISVLDNTLLELLYREINNFYWNKAKYLMLAEIVTQSNKDVYCILNENEDWLDGIIASLYKPGLVSAGTDMYFSLLKKIKSEMEWCKIFMEPLMELLIGDSRKAIENFSNYWCLTTLKTYPSLSSILLQYIGNKKGENTFATLSLLKQVNKLGLITKEWNNFEANNNTIIKGTVIPSLDHRDTQIRMMAFEILCISQKKMMPFKIEYDLILEFLKNNVNSDCTVLRINMLKSFTEFLTQTHISYRNYHNVDQQTNVENLKKFCVDFQTFVIDNLKMGGNYQRKITVIKLTNIFLTGLSEVPRKRQKQTKSTTESIRELLKSDDKLILFKEDVIMNFISLLRDPADDIRENVTEVLLNHYSQEFRQAKRMNVLIKDALESLSSKFFYEISCGQSMFRFITTIILQEKVNATFKSIEDVFSFGFNELKTEYAMKRSAMEAIDHGKQLHSFLRILCVVLETSFQKNYKIDFEDMTSDLLDILEGISNQFVWEEETCTSSDFSKMSDMVQALIISSGYTASDICNDETKTSGLYQIVLNCLWLNVKATCELCALLVRHHRDDTKFEEGERALNIISHVLETCRHKGAIEAAGSSLGHAIQHLSSLPNETEISKLPFIFLKSKLNEMIQEANKMASVTRRGAGLSIMVHRVVSSDAKRGKPLFHYFMKTILETCNQTGDIPRTVDSADHIDNVRDLPKAIYIHFLTRVVTDSSLAADIMFYSADLAKVAFTNLTSPYWQIRNAALQLYGAFIQKLIGQKKAAGANEETIATVACDELRTHSPELWGIIKKQIQQCTDDKMQYHSDLVPILNLLANLAKRYNFSSDLVEQTNEDQKLLRNLMTLLNSPVYTVRRLTAKSIHNIFCFENVYQELVDTIKIDMSENSLHGSLMVVAHYNKEDCKEMFENVHKLYSNVFNARRHSYLCMGMFEEIFHLEIDIPVLQQTLMESQKNLHSPGIFLWAQKRFRRYISNCNWDVIPEVIKVIHNSSDYEYFNKCLLEKLEDTTIPDIYVPELLNTLLNWKNNLESGITWKIIYILSKRVDLANILLDNVIEVGEHINKVHTYKLRYMIPFLAKAAAALRNDMFLEIIIKTIYSFVEPDIDVDMRYIAAIANNELGPVLRNIPQESAIIAIKSAIILTQDEDETVRISSSDFYKQAVSSKFPSQPYICLLRLLSVEFLSSFLDKCGIAILCKELLDFIDKNSSKATDDYNPFTNDCSNIYLEINVFRQLIQNIQINIQ